MNLYILIKTAKNINDRNEKLAEYDRAANEVINEMYTMKPYVMVSHTNGSNVIYMDVRWKGTQIAKYLERIRKIENVDKYFIYYNPLGELNGAVEAHDFFKAYVMGCTLLESYGSKVLKKYFEINGLTVANDQVNSIHFQTVILMLYTHKIIDNVLFCRMTKINKIRNNLIVHKDIENGLNEKVLKEITEYIDRIQPCVETLRLIYSEYSK